MRAAINNPESDGLVCCADRLRCTGAGTRQAIDYATSGLDRARRLVPCHRKEYACFELREGKGEKTSPASAALNGKAPPTIPLSVPWPRGEAAGQRTACTTPPVPPDGTSLI